MNLTRLIPTCVGSTRTVQRLQCTTTAHPHVCGEHGCPAEWQIFLGGSSPRVWGARRLLCLHGVSGRLIPTCVGSTCPWGRIKRQKSAHPHVCGEHLNTGEGYDYPKGSSPRVWGALILALCQKLFQRLIPTCVGSTDGVAPARVCCSAHPHVCGEHAFGLVFEALRGGSSPRVWGAHLLTWDFIPTHQVLELVWSPKPVLTLHDFWAYRRREARLYLLALLHPFRGPRSSFGADGRIISFTPSKSTGSHG